MKKYIIIAIALILVVVFSRPQVIKAIGLFVRTGFDTSGLRLPGANSTSSPAFLQTGVATGTMLFSSDDAQSATLNMQVFASSTPGNPAGTNLLIERQACDAAPFNPASPLSRGIDCFTYDDTYFDPARTYPASTTIALASSTVPLSYKPAIQGATTTKAVKINLLPARYTKLIFFLASSTPSPTYKDGLNLYVDVVLQGQRP